MSGFVTGAGSGVTPRGLFLALNGVPDNERARGRVERARNDVDRVMPFLSPAQQAKARLRHIIPQDRERVPAWRWVPSTYFWRGMPITGWRKNGKPVYCWERRR